MTYELDYIRVYTRGEVSVTPPSPLLPSPTPTPPPVTLPPSASVLPAPTNVRVVSGDGGVTLSWDPVTDTRVDQYSARYVRSDSQDKASGAAWTYP